MKGIAQRGKVNPLANAEMNKIASRKRLARYVAEMAGNTETTKPKSITARHFVMAAIALLETEPDSPVVAALGPDELEFLGRAFDAGEGFE